jgi:alpha-tubulin suppressor-like RCC1 family protein
MPFLQPITQISLGQYHSLILSNGVVYSFGSNIQSQLGIVNDNSNILTPTPIQLNQYKISNVIGSSTYSLITQDTSITCNGISQYGNGVCNDKGACLSNDTCKKIY